MSDEATTGWFQVPNSLIDRVAREIGPTALVVYVALLRHAGQQGGCCIRQSVLAEETGLARETVNRAVGALAERGLLSVESNRFAGAPNRFTLHLTAKRCDAGSHGGVTQDHTGVIYSHTRCDAGSQGVCATITPGVTQDHTEEDSLKKTFLKRQDNNNDNSEREPETAVAVAAAVVISAKPLQNKPDRWEQLAAETSRAEVAEALSEIRRRQATDDPVVAPIEWAKTRIYANRDKTLIPAGPARAAPWQVTAEALEAENAVAREAAAQREADIQRQRERARLAIERIESQETANAPNRTAVV